jgi:hypothetical protein
VKSGGFPPSPISTFLHFPSWFFFTPTGMKLPL